MGQVGRPRKENLYRGRIRSAEDIIADRLPDLIQNLLELSNGIWIEETDSHGKRKVYSRPPDRESNVYLINRIMGKVPDKGPDSDDLEQQPLEDADGNPITT